MNPEQIIAHAAASHIDLVNGQLPRDVQWMPPGRQVVQPMGFDEPFEMDITPAIAAASDRQLQQLRSKAAAGLDAEPYGDFNHKDEERSFKPVKFFWGGDDPKAGGVRMELAWTGAGAKAVEDGSQACISPSWLLNKATKAFLGITHNVGGLVPRSAFHSIQAFAKAEAVNHNPKQNVTMTNEEFKKMLDDGLKPINEQITALAKLPDRIGALELKANAGVTAANAKPGDGDDKIVKLFEDRLKPFTDKLTAFETAQQNAVKAQAKSAVLVHVARGAIAPEDKTTVEFFETAYLANASATEAIMSKLPGKTPRRIISQPANGGTSTITTAVEPEERILAQAKEMRKNQPDVFKSDAAALTAYLASAAGRAEYESFRNDIVTGANGRLPQMVENKK